MNKTTRCTQCNEQLLEKDAVWLELSQTDNQYYDAIPAEHVSQGGFPFCLICAQQIREAHYVIRIAAKLRSDGMTKEDFEIDPFDEKALRILAKTVAPKLNHQFFLRNREQIRQAVIQLEFHADKVILTDREKIREFYDDHFGPGWAGASFIWPKSVHVYGGVYYIEEGQDGVFSFDGNHFTSTSGTLSECETALFNAYIK